MKHFYLATILVAASAIGAAAQNVTIVGKDGVSTKFNVDYVQEITFEKMAPAGFTEFKNLTCDPGSSGGYATFNFGTEDGSTTMQLFVYGASNALYLADGAYNVTASGLPNTVDSDPEWSFISQNGETKYLKEGIMEVSSQEGKYTINMEFTLTDDSTFKGSYIGTIDNYSKYLRFTATTAKILSNMYGDMKVYLTDDDPSTFELMLNVFCDGDATSLPDTRYVLSSSLRDVNIIYPKNSYLDILRPNSMSNKFSAANMNISTVDGERVISIDLQLTDGRNVHIDFKGNIQ